MTKYEKLRRQVLALVPADWQGVAPREVHAVIGGRVKDVSRVLVELCDEGVVEVRGNNNARRYWRKPLEKI